MMRSITFLVAVLLSIVASAASESSLKGSRKEAAEEIKVGSIETIEEEQSENQADHRVSASSQDTQFVYSRLFH
jgi:hypothetical protein